MRKSGFFASLCREAFEQKGNYLLITLRIIFAPYSYAYLHAFHGVSFDLLQYQQFLPEWRSIYLYYHAAL